MGKFILVSLLLLIGCGDCEPLTNWCEGEDVFVCSPVKQDRKIANCAQGDGWSCSDGYCEIDHTDINRNPVRYPFPDEIFRYMDFLRKRYGIEIVNLNEKSLNTRALLEGQPGFDLKAYRQNHTITYRNTIFLNFKPGSGKAADWTQQIAIIAEESTHVVQWRRERDFGGRYVANPYFRAEMEAEAKAVGLVAYWSYMRNCNTAHAAAESLRSYLVPPRGREYAEMQIDILVQLGKDGGIINDAHAAFLEFFGWVR